MRVSSRTKDKDLGVIQALLIRLNELRMPQALRLKKKVDAGEPLSDYDLRFVKRALSESAEAHRLAAKHPKYQPVVDEMTALYNEIVRKGAENEGGGAAGGKKRPAGH